MHGKTGQDVDKLLEAIVKRLPRRPAIRGAAASDGVSIRMYDEYRGAITYVRIVNGTVTRAKAS